MSLNIVITSKKRKKHASDLSPYPEELIPFQPVDGADTRYGQLYKPISAHPFKEAGIKGFAPIQPYKAASNLPSLLGALHSIGPVFQSSMMNLRRSLGIMTTNSKNIFTGIQLPSSLCWLWDRLLRLLFILSQRLQPVTYLLPPSLTVWIDCSLSPKVLGLIPLVNGNL